MFEKEAEEIMRQNGCRTHSGNFIQADKVCELIQKGAEFGYNKANEWHYVKDGDLPKAYQKCNFIYSNVYGKDGKISFSKSDINVLTGIYAFFLDEETGEETTEPCFYDDINDDEIGLKEVYAWREIPKPPKGDDA